MSQETQTLDQQQRARLIEDMRRILYEGMKKAEQAKNWELFGRYADAYCRMVG